MSKFGANIFWIATTFNYLWSSAICKNHSFKFDNLAPKLRSVAQIEWKKHPYIFFSTFSTSLSGKNRKQMEKFQKPKSCRQLP